MRICFVSHFALGALVPSVEGHVGGVERQTALMANLLSRKGHEVCVIVYRHNESFDYEGPVRIIETCEESGGVPILRFFYPRWWTLLKALRKADSEIYYHNCAEYVTGQVAYWCKRNRKKFVYSVASNPECEANPEIFANWRDSFFFRYGLRNADLIITQTHEQKFTLLESHGLESIPLPMPGAEGIGELSTSPVRRSPRESLRVIWIGRISREKRPEGLVKVAGELPNVEFLVIGDGPRDFAFSGAIIQQMESLSNVTYLGRVEFDDVHQYYRKTDILLCTSLYEGFPNTYLEAWAHGVPVITTVDCDAVINEKQLGFASPNIDELSEKIGQLSDCQEMLEEMVVNSFAYFREYHRSEIAIERFENCFSTLIDKSVD